MKIRKGFVSNSSTSSFIIAKEDESKIKGLLQQLYSLNNKTIEYLIFNDIDEVYLAEYDWWLNVIDLNRVHVIGKDNDTYLMKCMEMLEEFGIYSTYRHGG